MKYFEIVHSCDIIFVYFFVHHVEGCYDFCF